MRRPKLQTKSFNGFNVNGREGKEREREREGGGGGGGRGVEIEDCVELNNLLKRIKPPPPPLSIKASERKIIKIDGCVNFFFPFFSIFVKWHRCNPHPAHLLALHFNHFVQTKLAPHPSWSLFWVIRIWHRTANGNRVGLKTNTEANNRVLRLPAIVLLNTTFRPGNSGLLRVYVQAF